MKKKFMSKWTFQYYMKYNGVITKLKGGNTMNKVKGWIRKVIFKLLESDIQHMIDNSVSNLNNGNLEDESVFKDDIKFEELIGYKIEVRHYTEEESRFINVDAVLESSSYIKDSETDNIVCNSKKVVFIDTNKSVYKLDNIYEYEIRRREVLHR